jgi:hypothetical protein
MLKSRMILACGIFCRNEIIVSKFFAFFAPLREIKKACPSAGAEE